MYRGYNMLGKRSIRARVIGGLGVFLFASSLSVSAQQPVYSKEFVDAYQPLEAAINSPGAELGTLKPQIAVLQGFTVSPDEKLALGALMFNAGIIGKDQNIQFDGVKLMLASGKTDPSETGRFNVVASQLAGSLKQYDVARTYLQKAIDLNFTGPNIAAPDLQLTMAELFFSEQRDQEGLRHLADAIAARKGEGLPVDEKWYRRGVSVAYAKQIVPQVYDFASEWVIDNPAPENWRDAINVAINLNQFDADELLELGLLGDRVGVPMDRKLSSKSMKNKTSIEKSAAQYILSRKYAAAEASYISALQNGIGNINEIYLRLGIAQAVQGKATQSLSSFGKVAGRREPIARLWTAYLTHKFRVSAKTLMPLRSAPRAETPSDKCLQLGFVQGTQELAQCISMLRE